MSKIKVTDYLVERLLELNITDVFGLPGDYNFNIVEAVEKNPKTKGIGCTNELNAGYAADGYARLKGYGALITTYGVGELSAMNASAGSFAEYVPVIHIFGVPASKFIKHNTILHHNFANPDYYAYAHAFKNVTATTAYLNENNAKEETDRVLSVFINEKKPVYIAIPVDVCDCEIENSPDIKINSSDSESLNAAVEHALKLINKSQKPVIIADVLTERFQAVKQAKEFIKKSQYAVSTFLMGKGLIEYDYDKFLGTYIGKFDNISAYNFVNSSDCVITIGAIISDLNTFGFDLQYNPSDYIEIYGTYTVIENCVYENVRMIDILEKLTEKVPTQNYELPEHIFSFSTPKEAEDTKLAANYLYPRLQDFLKDGDIIFSETGIAKFGIAPIKIPKNANLYNQVLWGSIGWATPAAFGACVAEKAKRVVLLTGEGSHQLTAQEISSIMRYNLKPIIIVINNDGYTIERVLSKDPLDKFNDIAQWDYSKLPHAFKGNVWTVQARTNAEFDEALNQAESKQKDMFCYIEIFVDKMDLPTLTRRILESKFAPKATK